MKRIKITPFMGFLFLMTSCTLLAGCSNKPSSLQPEPAAIQSSQSQEDRNEAPGLKESTKKLVKKVTKADFATSDPTPEKSQAALLKSPEKLATQEELRKLCVSQLVELPGKKDNQKLDKICSQVTQLDGCLSEKGEPIYHYDKISDDPRGKRILTISLIHGDEHPSGSVARSWMSRLDELSPRNSWRVIPVANPDGLLASTRMNSNGVDLNRNFPTKNWDAEAVQRWKTVKKSDPRRFPGSSGGSERETRCMIKHFEDFKPDFIISIHTPLGVLDFDGPPMNFPQFSSLPWISLGHYPGSLGRYMWRDHKVPVMTIELKGTYGVDKLEKFDRLQDISGTVAIQAGKILKSEEQANN